MRRAALAEKLLALAATRDRAAAVIGDLLEEEASHGHRWFWLTVAGTAVAFAYLNVVRFLSGRHSVFSGMEFMEPLMSFWRFVWSRRWLLVVPVLLFTTATSLVAYSMPIRYRSEATITVVPSRVAERVVRSTTKTRVEDRLQSIGNQILSRARLERIINEYGLYEEERKTGKLEDIIEHMRTHEVSIELQPREGDSEGAAITVSFTAADPRIAQKVTERLASLFIDESVRDRMIFADSATMFLDGQIDYLAGEVDHLADHMARDRTEHRPSPRSKVIEYEEIQNAYRALFAKREEARLVANLDQRQIGEQFRMISPAQIPTHPDGPDRLTVGLFGPGAGLCCGLFLMLASSWRRPAPPAAVAPPA